MKTRRFLALFMAIAMVFAMCAYASADSGKTETKEETTAAESAETEETGEKEAEATDDITKWVVEAYTQGNDFQPLYDAIAKSIYTEYIEPNGITSEEFKWPDSISQAWLYLANIANDYSSYPDTDIEVLKTENMTFFLEEYSAAEDSLIIPTTEDELKLMNAVLDGMIIWYEENYEPNERSEFVTAYHELPAVDKIIPGSISFSDIEAAAEK